MSFSRWAGELLLVGELEASMDELYHRLFVQVRVERFILSKEVFPLQTSCAVALHDMLGRQRSSGSEEGGRVQS